MLKVVLIADSPNAMKDLQKKLQELPTINVIAAFLLNEYASDMLIKYQPDLIITSNATLDALINLKPISITPRQNVKAITHKGIRLVPIENIYYFQAEHKYVTAYHTQGQLLIEDTLNSLEREFGHAFVRVHRKTLVAKDKIENLLKDESGQYLLKLRGREEHLIVSRRQLPHVRKILLWI